MAIVPLGANDSGSTSRTVINDNFTDLDTTKADLASPTFTGTPTLPTGTIAVTQSAGDNSTKVATTAYVETAVDAFTSATFPVSSAFSGASPSSYTDLNLSSIIGASSRVVFLKITNGTTSAAFHFRKNGETGVGATGDNSAGVNRTSLLGSGGVAYVSIVTDSSGIVEWYSSQTGVGVSSSTTTVTVEAYW